jgi:hypothetical protein
MGHRSQKQHSPGEYRPAGATSGEEAMPYLPLSLGRSQVFARLVCGEDLANTGLRQSWAAKVN